jgi:hypothetical protein
VLFFVLVRMMLGVVLRGFMTMVGRVQAVGVRHMGVMTGLVVITVLVVLRGFAMMLCGLFVMVGRGLVMRAAFVTFRHIVLLVCDDRHGDDDDIG